jgi:flagellar protein FlaG
VDDAALEAAVSQVADYVQNVQRNLSFSVDKESGHTVVKVIDSKSDEVIRQIPSEELLALARRLTDMNREDVKGVLVQSSA